jgi:hypothetical protein
VTTAPIYYDSDGSKPDVAVNTTGNKYSISEVVRTLNFKKLNLSTGIGAYVNYDSFSIYRLAYSLAYYYVTENMIGLDPDTKVAINTGAGLLELFSSRNLTITDYSKYTDDTNDVVKDTFNATTFTNNVIQPGDILASYRHHTTLSKKTIYNIINSEQKTVYAYDNFNEEEIDGQAIFGMLLYRDNTTVYIYDSFLGILAISLSSDYNNTKYQEDDKYKKFYHGTNEDLSYDNEKETGYYTLNAVKKVEEAVYDDSGTYAYYYFKYNGSNTPYIKQGSYYYSKSSFESKWTTYQNQAKKYDEYLDNKDAWTAYDSAIDAWNKNQALWTKYESDLSAWQAVEDDWTDYYAELAIWNGMSAEEIDNYHQYDEFYPGRVIDVNNVDTFVIK